MTTVRVRRAGDPWESAVEGRGATVAAAVRPAVHALGLTPGRTIGSERRGTHEWAWTWGRRDERHELVVRESRSGPSGEGTRRQVQLRLDDEVADRLDALADAAGLTRSAWVEQRVREATVAPRSA